MSDSFVSVVFFEKIDDETKFRHEVLAAVIECTAKSVKAVCLQPGLAWSDLDKAKIWNSFQFCNVLVNGTEVEAKVEPFHQMMARQEGSFDKYLQYWLVIMPINEQTRKLTKLEWYPKSTCNSMLTDKYASCDGKVVRDDSWHIGICLIKNGMLVGFETALATQKMLCNVRAERRTDLF